MKVTIFNGSPSGETSATHKMCTAFLAGAARAGAQTEEVLLAREDVGFCRGCFACWFKTPGRCVQRDAMDRLLPLYRASDIVGLASPVFTWNMTANLKAFVDRLAPLKAPRMTEEQGYFDLEDATPREQRFIVLSNCGFPGQNNFDVMRPAMACCNPVLEVYRNCGKLLSSHDERAQRLVEPFLRALEDAGEELVAAGGVSAATRAALEAELMSPAEYASFLGM